MSHRLRNCLHNTIIHPGNDLIDIFHVLNTNLLLIKIGQGREV